MQMRFVCAFISLTFAMNSLANEMAAHANGTVSHMPNASTMHVLIKDSDRIKWINRQIAVRLRGISPAQNSLRGSFRLDGLMLGQSVDLLHCASERGVLTCDAQISPDGRRDVRYDVADFLVANGLARRP